mmetsp:Transcript_23201/g.48266  ORF Transcript_23201/g.48266 Transcript_23201/m.48266 type:complete len:254 (-) Transcript_23201:70-831(-)|eukprot:CAMPEP_0172444840 /NCGR_PEP_ID=MMETSP1065-20121228/4835_1 /TAXON_ID=265537 /ORGANISM="Amphiprora paludosa, Strain CCMP125" /LENGTH=253 /DNA_ID=CAMNT_0013195543 /DNA_START=42 /DNA_END=803 /DNA_ORIENTATION=+
MGNKLAKDFKNMKLGHGHINSANSGRNAIVPDAVVLDASMTIAVQKDAKEKNIQFFDTATQKRLFVTTITKSESMGSITKDARGNVLFITKAPNKSTRVIHKTSDTFDKDVGSEPSSIDSDDDDLSPVAKIEIDHVASAVTAFLSVRYKRRKPRVRGDGSAHSGSYASASQTTGMSSGVPSSIDLGADPTYIDVYKAVKIPAVKFGAAIVDMRGQVVGKAAHEPKAPLPTVLVAPGADASAVVALACIVNGDL